MRKFILAFVAVISLGSVVGWAANYTMTQGSGTTFGSVVVAGVNYAQQLICDLTTPAQCASVSAGGALKVDNSAVTQPVSAASLPLPGGAATAAKQPAIGTAGTASVDILTVQGIASMTPFLTNPGTAANWGVGTSTQNSATVANGHLVLGQFNTTPTTITSGNMSPFQLDNAGNLLVNIKAGASSGAVAQGSTTSGQTGGLTQCASTSSAPTYTTATTNPVNCDTAGNLRVSVSNANNNGQALAAASSPVVLPVLQQTGGPTGSAVPANAGYAAGDAQSSEPTKATTGNLTGAFYDLTGKQVTSPYANRENFLNCAVTITGTGATTVTGCGAQGASVKIYITNLCVTRNDAGATAVSATLNDSATSIYDVPNNGGGGGICPPLPIPLQVAANTAFQVTMGSSITSIHVTASGFKGY